MVWAGVLLWEGWRVLRLRLSHEAARGCAQDDRVWVVSGPARILAEAK